MELTPHWKKIAPLLFGELKGPGNYRVQANDLGLILKVHGKEYVYYTIMINGAVVINISTDYIQKATLL